MSNIDRYSLKFNGGNVDLFATGDGPWVKYHEHVEALGLERAKKNHLKTVLEDAGFVRCHHDLKSETIEEYLDCDACVGMGWANPEWKAKVDQLQQDYEECDSANNGLHAAVSDLEARVKHLQDSRSIDQGVMQVHIRRIEELEAEVSELKRNRPAPPGRI